MFTRVAFLCLVVSAVASCGDSTSSPQDPSPPSRVASIDVTPLAAALVPGQSHDLESVARDSVGGTIGAAQISWSSSSVAVATVTGSGRVTAVAPGTASITASSGGVTASTDVTVGEGGFVGVGGGIVSALGGNVRLEVRPGGVTTGTAFTVGAASDVPGHDRLIAGTAVTVGPASVTFGTPAALRLRYPNGLGAGVVIPRLRLARLVDGAWQEIAPLPVDRDGRLAAGEILASGTYAVLTPPESLRGLAQLVGFEIASEVNPLELRTDPDFRQNLAEHFGSVTPGNPMKFGPIHPQPGTYNFADADLVVDFAESWGMAVHGHVLLWHSQQPAWLMAGSPTRTSLLAALEDHIETVVGRYRGRLRTWDVANEMIADDGSGLRPTFWTTIVGPDVVDSAFVWAHRADPDAKLYLNEYGAEWIQPKADSLLALAKRLKAAGIPIHGVGFQGHYGTNYYAPSRAEIEANLARFVDEGFDVRITEIDVRLPNGEDGLGAQATIFRDNIEACLTSPGCNALTVWGSSDRYSWIPNHAPGFGRAHPFDDALNPKPAYWALRDALAGAAGVGTDRVIRR
jgi:endo-1,4-beta-xylanase